MDHFELVSEYAPTGDQPQAIDQLVKGFQEGNQCQTLLGVTGSGKTFTMIHNFSFTLFRISISNSIPLQLNLFSFSIVAVIKIALLMSKTNSLRLIAGKGVFRY